MVDKEWEKPANLPARDLKKVTEGRRWFDTRRRTEELSFHFASLMDLCHFKRVELAKATNTDTQHSQSKAHRLLGSCKNSRTRFTVFPALQEKPTRRYQHTRKYMFRDYQKMHSWTRLPPSRLLERNLYGHSLALLWERLEVPWTRTWRTRQAVPWARLYVPLSSVQTPQWLKEHVDVCGQCSEKTLRWIKMWCALKVKKKLMSLFKQHFYFDESSTK